MVSTTHEALHRVFRTDPDVFARIFGKLGEHVPAAVSVDHLPTDLTEIEPLERRLDTLLRFNTADGASYLLLVEAQLADDPDKVSAWAYYISYLYARYRVPPVLLVVCHDTGTAAWASAPFAIGPPGLSTLILRARVLGPHNMPVIVDRDEAAGDIVLAMFAALTHLKDPRIADILEALAAALESVDDLTAEFVREYTEIGLGKYPAAQTWRNLMAFHTSFFRSETAQRIRAEGRAEGRVEGCAQGREQGRAQALAECVVRVLEGRRVSVPGAVRARIESCADLDQLNLWLDRALSVDSAAGLFG